MSNWAPNIVLTNPLLMRVQSCMHCMLVLVTWWTARPDFAFKFKEVEIIFARSCQRLFSPSGTPAHCQHAPQNGSGGLPFGFPLGLGFGLSRLGVRLNGISNLLELRELGFRHLKKRS